MQQLKQYSPGLTQQQKDELFTTNFETINQALQFLGVSVIAQQFVSGQSNVGGSLANTQYASSFQSSGGLIVILANIPVELIPGGVQTNATLVLLIDGKQVASAGIESANTATSIVMVPLVFVGNYNAGNHSVNIQAIKSGGSANVGSAVSAGFYVIEVRNP